MTYIGAKDFLLEVAFGNVGGLANYNKFGSNADVDTATTPEDIWSWGGVYTGFTPTAGEAVALNSASGQDAGTKLSQGTATSGSETTLVDMGATFVLDGVAVGDLLINDDQGSHGIITVVAATTLTVARMDNGLANSTDAYRVATMNGTGVGVVKMNRLLETDYDGHKTEYVILNGATAIATVGTAYIRNSRGIAVLFGTGGTTAGQIKATQVLTPANIFFSIEAGHDQSLVACDTVPKGMTLYITGLSCKMARSTGADGSAEFDFSVREINQGGFNTKVHEYITNTDGFRAAKDYVLVIPEYSDYRSRIGEVSDNNTQVSVQVNGYLKTN